MNPVLQLEQLSITHVRGNDRMALVRDVSLDLRPGEIHGLVGESGSGKSLTARAVMRNLPRALEAHGSILFEGRDVTTLSGPERRQLLSDGVGMIFQDPRSAINPVQRIDRFLMEALRFHKRADPRDEGGLRPRILAALESTGIRDPERVAHSFPHQLSGGLLQRAMIASVMLMRPKVLLADEPTTALDLSTQGEVLKTLVAMRAEHQMSIILITHDLDLAASVCDRVSVMYAGSVVETQPSQALYQGPRHPYSQGLFLSRPRLATRSGALPTMPGRPTTLVELPSDRCTFAPRCWAADEKCTRGFPALVPVPEGLVRCVHAEKVHDQSRSVIVNEPSEDRAPASSQRDPVMLSVLDLSKSFGTGRRHETRAVETVSFSVPNQDSLAIIGESGSGKTTTARMILGLERPTSGQIHVAGEDWSAPPSRRGESKRRARTAQMVFQDPLGSLDPSQTIGEAMTEVRREHFAESAVQRDRHIRDLADRVGLSTKQLDSRPMSLSGGQRQRAAIARALVIGSPLLVLDEPASALDVSIQATIINLLNELRRSMGLTYLLISHDIGVVAQLAERAVVMQRGEIVEEGALGSVLNHPSHAYTKTLMASLPQPAW